MREYVDLSDDLHRFCFNTPLRMDLNYFSCVSSMCELCDVLLLQGCKYVKECWILLYVI